MTAKPGTGQQSLVPGVLYQYEIELSVAGSTNRLADPGGVSVTGGTAPFAYEGLSEPTFALVPSAVTDVVIVHGSCRKPHGEGYDALARLDEVIRDSAKDPMARPHLCLLTGGSDLCRRRRRRTAELTSTLAGPTARRTCGSAGQRWAGSGEGASDLRFDLLMNRRR